MAMGYGLENLRKGLGAATATSFPELAKARTAIACAATVLAFFRLCNRALNALMATRSSKSQHNEAVPESHDCFQEGSLDGVA